MNGDEFSQTAHPPKAEHRPFSSSKRQMRVLSPIVLPASRFMSRCIADNLQCCLAIPAFAHIAFQHFPFVIHGAPQILHFAVDLHEDLVEMPPPVRMSTHLVDPVSADLRREQRAESVSPKLHRRVADFDPAHVQEIFYISKRPWKTNVQHHRQADDFRTCLEISNGLRFVIRRGLETVLPRSRRFCLTLTCSMSQLPTKPLLRQTIPEQHHDLLLHLEPRLYCRSRFFAPRGKANLKMTRTFFSMPIIQSVREVDSAKVCIALFLGAIGVGLVGHIYAIPLRVLVRDPAAEFDFPAYAGFLSHIGIAFMVATSAVTFFTAMVAYQLNGSYSTILPLTSIFSIFLAIDDLFLLHELASRLGEVIFFACLGLAICAIMYLLFKNAQGRDLRGLFWALGFLGVSIFSDLLKIYGPFRYWLEDFSKLAGMGGWFIFWCGYSKAELLMASKA